MNQSNVLKTLLLAASTVMVSCMPNDDVQDTGQSEVTISATVGNSTDDPNARTTSLIYDNLVITDVRMSVDNVKLILRATGANSNKPTIVQFRTDSPKTFTLVKDGEVNIVPIGSAMAYNDIYGKFDFDLVKAQDVPEDDEMFGRSVIAKATWFGIPAAIYIDLEDKVEVMFNQGLEVDGAQNLILTVYMDKFLEGVNPALVSDGNGDGMIEVGPDDEDGNGEAYAAILANIESALVLKNGSFKSN